MNEDRAEKEGYSSLELFRAELARVHHLDWVALTTFALLGLPALGLLGFHEMAGPSEWPLLVLGPAVVALAAAGAHALVGNASDYWISFTVASQALKASGLTDKGAFPLSLMAYPPHTLGGFVRRWSLAPGGRSCWHTLSWGRWEAWLPFTTMWPCQPFSFWRAHCRCPSPPFPWG